MLRISANLVAKNKAVKTSLQPCLKVTGRSSTKCLSRAVSCQAFCIKSNDQGRSLSYAKQSSNGILLRHGFNPFIITSRNLSLSAHQWQKVVEEITNNTVTSVKETASSETVPPVSSTTGGGDATVAATSGTHEELVLDFLPEKPTPLVDTEVMTQWVGDPPLEALGLASWWPPGRAQYFMEYLHVGFDLPWWGVIAVTTVCLRFICFPLVVKVQRNTANMTNHNPEMVRLQQKITEARKRGDMHDLSKYGLQLQDFMKDKQIKPIANLVPVLVQLPIFMSMFLGLRGMANLPLESMMSGGLFWFKDLTAADPYYALPVLTSVTMFLQFKFAADGASFDTAGPIAKNVFRIIPFVLLPLTINFPAAVTFYWFTTNLVSIVQAKVTRTKAIRERLNIPEIIKAKKDNSKPVKVRKPGIQGVVEFVKESRQNFREMIDNAKSSADVADRRRYDEDVFRKAGTGRPKRTFKFDPTKPRV